MTTLAGHGKDPRLVQAEIPILPIIEGDENYTPEYFIEPCRKFLGRIELDPFSCELANKIIGADVFWNKDDDALSQVWTVFKRKWVNPPYSAKLIGKAIAKTLEYAHIGETLLLVNTSSSAKWFHACMEKCSAYLHPSRRINFDSPYRTSKANRYDQTLFYFGDRPLEFAQALSTLGNAVQPIKLCSPISICSGELEPLALPPETQEKSPPSPIATSAKTRKKSTKAISLKSPSTETSTTTTPAKESISIQEVFPAPTQVPQVTKKDLTETSLSSGTSTCESSTKDIPSLSSLRTPLDYFIVEWERSSQAYPPAGTMRSGKFSALPCLEVPKKEKGCLSLPTLTTGLGKTRNAGATRCERYLKDKQFLQDTQALSVEMMGILFGFPMDWAQCLLESPKEPREEMRQEPCLDELSTSTAPPSFLNGSCTLIEFSGNNIDAETNLLLDRADLVADENSLELLLDQARRLRESGAAPDGIWLSSSKVRDRDFYQVQWRSREQHPWLGNQKSRYVGISDSDEHKSAIALHRAGQQLRKIEKQIKKLQEKEKL